MDEQAAMKTMPMPRVPIEVTPAKAGDIITLNGIKCRILEDGTNTSNRLGAAEFTLPPNMAGPPPHWHEMHDETFLVTKGVVRFRAPDGKTVDAQEGDYVAVPTRAPHTFENVGEEEAVFFNTFTPAYYINYFRLMEAMVERSGGPAGLSREMVMEAMSHYATLPAVEMMKQAQQAGKGGAAGK